jgi:hypothetical protein
MLRLPVLLFLVCSFSWGSSLTQKSLQEIQDVQDRLREFYQYPPKPEALDRQGIKVDAETGKSFSPHPELSFGNTFQSRSLIQQAQVKATPAYRKWYCQKVLKKISPLFPCDGIRTWADFEKDDRVEDLARTWVAELIYQLDDLPTEGTSSRPLWSDDYWAMSRGLTSYRYSERKWYEKYLEAVQAYLQPQEWTGALTLGLEELNSQIVKWSPSEKYDLTARDEEFTLTQEQKSEGQWYQDESGKVEGWMGLCHGWAPASIMVPRPERPVSISGPKGVSVLWYPNDIKAMVTLAWANGSWGANFIGRRCEEKKLKKMPNGRISTQDCFDNNPATFHLALGNLIGKEKASFIMDKAYDYQVWNQPVVAYEFTYFNPLDPDEKSKKWKEVAVPYDKKFKRKDRFQKPLTRGRHLEGPDGVVHRTSRQDGHIKKIVGVEATVVYLLETSPPDHSPEPGRDIKGRDIYLYDLEIASKGNKWVITGGEWHQNNHPDFLFVPEKGSVTQAYWDQEPFELTGEGNEPEPAFLDTVRKASNRSAYPLCKVVKSLIEGATDSENLRYYSSTIP